MSQKMAPKAGIRAQSKPWEKFSREDIRRIVGARLCAKYGQARFLLVASLGSI